MRVVYSYGKNVILTNSVEIDVEIARSIILFGISKTYD